MRDGANDSVADLREVAEFANERKAYSWRQLRTYGRLDDALPWFAGVAAGVAGITAAIEAPAALTAAVAFASALSTAVAKPVRDRRVHAVHSHAEYYDIAWLTDQAARNDPDDATRLNSLRALHARLYELEKKAGP